MCDVCADFLHLLVSYESRLSNKDSDHPTLHKNEVDIAFNYIHTWPQRQCMCCYRDVKNFERFNLIIQSVICLCVCQLKNIKCILNTTTTSDIATTSNNNSSNNNNNAADEAQLVISSPQQSTSSAAAELKKSEDAIISVLSPKASSSSASDPIDEAAVLTPILPAGIEGTPGTSAEPQQSPVKKEEEKYNLQEIEKLLILVSKAFLLNFPLYVAYKHGVQARWDEISAQEAQSFGLFCDFHDTEVPAFLFRNVSLFCNSGGFSIMSQCFEQTNFPVSTAHAVTAVISNLKIWLNYRSTVQLFVPIRIKVLQYMCKLSDQELRSPATRSMADFMWAAVKDPLDSHVNFDTEGLALAFKYFTSSTLTMRLAGMAQINAHINLFNDICTSETVAEVEIVGQKLGEWLTENQIISHLFGPNLHVEVIKQSHIVLNFLAVENQITEEHINLIWQAAQLKHCSKPVYDILPSLVKNLAPRPAMHLYLLLCRLDPKEHTEQSIYIASALTKLIWSRDSIRQHGELSANIPHDVSGLASSSENSVSIDGSNSDDDQNEEDSSEDRKSPIEIEACSDSGAPPCKQARHKQCCDENPTDESKITDIDITDEVDTEKMKEIDTSNMPIMDRIMVSLHEGAGSSSDENIDAGNYSAIRKKVRKRKKSRLSSKTKAPLHQDLVETISDVESPSDSAVINDSDCSEGQLQASVLNHLHAEGPFIGAISDGYSSPMSNKSEKNMADFDDEDSPCEEELVQLAARAHCLAFNIPRARSSSIRDGNSSSEQGGSVKSERRLSGTKMSCDSIVLKESGSHGIFKISDVCTPGNTLLWDLLQDDKIGQLGDSLALEAEKALGSLLCFSTDKFIRTKFIEGCLQNLASNRSVIVSLRLLPKLFASFQQFRVTDTHQVTMWAERQHKMMYNFFNNLKHYANSCQNEKNMKSVLHHHNGGLLYSHLTQVQVRLQFLTSVMSSMGSPDSFRLTIEQVDILWSWLSNDSECADCLFAWLQCQAKGGDQHALGVDALQHLYLKKLPELKPEGISMVALGLFQQLCSLARLAAAHYDTPTDSSLDIVGMSHLWKIALKANNTDVSLAAIQYINSYYMGQQLKLEKEFVAHCMGHLTQAADELNNPDNRENALMCVQRALMLLITHLETFRRRYAYHLRRWDLEGKRFSSHSALRSEGPGPPIKIILQPGGVPDKSVLHLHATDFVADLKAEIAKWWETLQGGVKNSGGTAPVLGLLLSDGPLRIITQGQELSAEHDERTLVDVGFKDNQMVFVSLGGREGRRREHIDQLSLQPPPSKDCLPTLLLLQPEYFEQLFKLMQTLGDMKMPGKRGNYVPHTKAQLLSRRVWNTLAMLPTNASVLDNLKGLYKNQQKAKQHLAEKITTNDESEPASIDDDATDNKMETSNNNESLKSILPIQELLDPNNLQKFMYTLHIVESICKTKYTGNCCGSPKTISKFNAIKIKSLKSNSQKSPSKHRLDSTSEKAKITEENDDEKMMEDEPSVPRDDKTNNAEMASPEKVNCSSPIKLDGLDEKDEMAIPWCDIFIKCGGLRHLYEIFMSGVLQTRIEDDNFNEWRIDCLATLLRVMCLLGVEMKPEDQTPKLSEYFLSLINVKTTLKRISLILYDSSFPINPNQVRTGFWGRTQIIHFTMNFLVCFVHSSDQARELLWSDPEYSQWLQRLVLDDPEPAVRREVCTGLYRIALGNIKTCHELMGPLLSKLVNFLPIAEKMTSQQINYSMGSSDEGKEPYGPACRDYFWLIGRLVDTLPIDMVKESLDEPQGASIDIEALCRNVAKAILSREYFETRHGNQDDGLVGLLTIIGNLLKYDPPFKFSNESAEFIKKIFDCLFELPTSQDRHKPKCKSQSSRASAYDLLIEMCRNCPKNYGLLHAKLMEQHRPGPHSPYHPWDYWPREEGRSECGYVGLTNLGATCYMASCIQHLYMMPQAREAILSLPPQAARKHATTLYELQRMFAYLLESERKSYNPKSFCRVYQMDHQPLNTGEQKDMAEFFIDLVSKLEEMTPELKMLVKQLFCGVLSNNVVSLDCGHVSRTLEEFYTVRCQVADMRNLHESLDEVTVKDTLEGDNMYTCSQCGKKVRAEKRACFKKLPQILCFNTMRYTFNMITMLKEKVNTHFSFPMRLDMVGYVEKTLMLQQYEEEKQKTKQRIQTQSESEVENNQNLNNVKDVVGDAVKSGGDSDAKCDKIEVELKDEPLSTSNDNNPKDNNGESTEQLEHYEYDLVGVTVHTGTADGGHYYSFIKERGVNGQSQDRWLLFNDAEVKIFDPSQIAAECFGGEMTSKTYDSVTEKYLDFSFEKTNSAYMLFYERRNPSNGDTLSCSSLLLEAMNQYNWSQSSSQTPSCSSGQKLLSHLPSPVQQPEANATKLLNTTNEDSGSSGTQNSCSLTNETDAINLNSDSLSLITNSNCNNLNISNNNCDIDVKSNKNNNNTSSSSSSTTSSGSTASSSLMNQNSICSILSKELEDWIWQDNRHFLQDKNIFEHTYFSFMWQICSHIPQTLLMQPDITCIAAQLSVSFFIETFIHAKEKPTMVLWVELLTKQFNSSQEACEWFLAHMSAEPWWPVQVLIQCPNQMVRQMFQRLVIHVIQRLRSSQCLLYLKTEEDEEGKETIGNSSCVTLFIKSLILLLEHGAKAHLRHLSEFFGLLYEFSRMGEEETLFLLKINIIRSVSDFYLGHKSSSDCVDKGSDNDDNSSDEELSTLSVDKTRPASLDKMIALVANLVERSRGPDLRLHLSARDYSAIAGGKGFPFLYQQIKDNINPHQTRHLIHALCRWDDRLANQIISMLFGAVTKHTELCGPFFKLLTLLTESSGGPSGLPCFSQLVLQRVWDAAEYCPQSALDWLAVQAPRNKIVHAWILNTAESWVEQFLLAHNNSRVRNAAAYLLVSLVPSQTFRTNYRTHHKLPLHTAQRELTGDAQLILHTILNLLLRLLRTAKTFTDISVHGTAKLTAYFTLMTYCMVSKTEKLMLGPHLRTLWELFHPRLSEPSVPVHHNKQALLVFWHHATNECSENAQFVAHCADITRNIAFNYILADHDDSEIVAYNRAMLPAYYGLLRLCCQQNRQLTRQLAAHQNLQWAFKNITPHPTQYAMAVDELFRLMTLFAARHPEASEVEQREISTFRRTTMSAYLTGLDARVSWGTLIAALRILVDNDEDRLFVVYNGGISMAFEALYTLHSMLHEATACHVSGDLQELLTEMVLLVAVLRNRDPKRRPTNCIMKELHAALRRLAELCNSYNPPEMRNLALEVLKEFVKNCFSETTNYLLPLLADCHVAAQNSPQSMGSLGPYFPRRGKKVSWPAVSKNAPRPPRPMLQMCIVQSQIMQKGVDKDYDAALEAFYKPYHEFLDVIFRMAVNLNQLNESLVNLSCLAGLEAASLHFNFFPKFWVGVHNNANTNKYVDLLIGNPFLVEYIDTVLRDERISLNDPIILKFLEIYYPKVTSRLAIPRLIDTICQVLPSKENLLDLCADLNAIRIIAQSTGIPPSVNTLLKTCLQTIVTRYKDLFNQDESPPKKRKLSTSEPPDNSTKSPTTTTTIIEETPLSPTPDSIIDPPPKVPKMDVSITETESVIKSIASTKPIEDNIISLTELTDKISSSEQDEIVDIEMDTTPEPEIISNKSEASSNSIIEAIASTSQHATLTPMSLPPPPPPPSIPPPSSSSSSSSATPSASKPEIDDRLSNSDLHKDIENNIEKILDCFSEDKLIADSPLSPSAIVSATSSTSTTTTTTTTATTLPLVTTSSSKVQQ